MAIGDLLWACPFCGAIGSIRKDGGGRSACARCATTYRRAGGSVVIARRPGAEPDARPAAQWVRALPAVEAALQGAAADSVEAGVGGEALREDRVEATFAGPDEAVRRAGEVLGFRETEGQTLTGALRLDASRLTFTADEGATRGWALADLTAIQSSSRVVQIKQRGAPVVTFRFLTGSPRLWEELLQWAVRALYRRLGRGEIREFQPRIVVR